MKATSRYPHSNRPKPSYFGHIFYWSWECTPKRGIPGRSFIILTIAQFAYFLFPFALCIPFFSDDTIRVLYEADENLKYFPIGAVFVFLVGRNMHIYDERKHREIKEYYMQVSPAERIRRKRQYLLFLATTVIVIVMEVWLFNMLVLQRGILSICPLILKVVSLHKFL